MYRDFPLTHVSGHDSRRKRAIRTKIRAQPDRRPRTWILGLRPGRRAAGASTRDRITDFVDADPAG